MIELLTMFHVAKLNWLHEEGEFVFEGPGNGQHGLFKQR